MELNQPKKAIEWYEKVASLGHGNAIKNLGNLYHDQGNNIKGAAYIFAMVNYGYTKDEVLSFLKNDWKLDRDTLQKAYELQKTLDIPKHYTGGID
jgi:TPR repeat protein